MARDAADQDDVVFRAPLNDVPAFLHDLRARRA